MIKLYLALIVRPWTALSTDSKMVELIDDTLGSGFCSVFQSREDAYKVGYTDEQLLELEVKNE